MHHLLSHGRYSLRPGPAALQSSISFDAVASISFPEGREATCPVCLEEPWLHAPRVAPCGHILCHRCWVNCVVAAQGGGRLEVALAFPSLTSVALPTTHAPSRSRGSISVCCPLCSQWLESTNTKPVLLLGADTPEADRDPLNSRGTSRPTREIDARLVPAPSTPSTGAVRAQGHWPALETAAAPGKEGALKATGGPFSLAAVTTARSAKRAGPTGSDPATPPLVPRHARACPWSAITSGGGGNWRQQLRLLLRHHSHCLVSDLDTALAPAGSGEPPAAAASRLSVQQGRLCPAATSAEVSSDVGRKGSSSSSTCSPSIAGGVRFTLAFEAQAGAHPPGPQKPHRQGRGGGEGSAAALACAGWGDAPVPLRLPWDEEGTCPATRDADDAAADPARRRSGRRPVVPSSAAAAAAGIVSQVHVPVPVPAAAATAVVAGTRATDPANSSAPRHAWACFQLVALLMPSLPRGAAEGSMRHGGGGVVAEGAASSSSSNSGRRRTLPFQAGCTVPLRTVLAHNALVTAAAAPAPAASAPMSGAAAVDAEATVAAAADLPSISIPVIDLTAGAPAPASSAPAARFVRVSSADDLSTLRLLLAHASQLRRDAAEARADEAACSACSAAVVQRVLSSGGGAGGAAGPPAMRLPAQAAPAAAVPGGGGGGGAWGDRRGVATIVHGMAQQQQPPLPPQLLRSGSGAGGEGAALASAVGGGGSSSSSPPPPRSFGAPSPHSTTATTQLPPPSRQSSSAPPSPGTPSSLAFPSWWFSEAQLAAIAQAGELGAQAAAAAAHLEAAAAATAAAADEVAGRLSRACAAAGCSSRGGGAVTAAVGGRADVEDAAAGREEEVLLVYQEATEGAATLILPSLTAALVAAAAAHAAGLPPPAILAPILEVHTTAALPSSSGGGVPWAAHLPAGAPVRWVDTDTRAILRLLLPPPHPAERGSADAAATTGVAALPSPVGRRYLEAAGAWPGVAARATRRDRFLRQMQAARTATAAPSSPSLAAATPPRTQGELYRAFMGIAEGNRHLGGPEGGLFIPAGPPPVPPSAADEEAFPALPLPVLPPQQQQQQQQSATAGDSVPARSRTAVATPAAAAAAGAGASFARITGQFGYFPPLEPVAPSPSSSSSSSAPPRAPQLSAPVSVGATKGTEGKAAVEPRGQRGDASAASAGQPHTPAGQAPHPLRGAPEAPSVLTAAAVPRSPPLRPLQPTADADIDALLRPSGGRKGGGAAAGATGGRRKGTGQQH